MMNLKGMKTKQRKKKRTKMKKKKTNLRDSSASSFSPLFHLLALSKAGLITLRTTHVEKFYCTQRIIQVHLSHPTSFRLYLIIIIPEICSLLCTCVCVCVNLVREGVSFFFCFISFHFFFLLYVLTDDATNFILLENSPKCPFYSFI